MILISHFWNERALMPYWVGHHLGLVDHAVLLDYDSDDGSAEIVRTMAPTWEIRKSRNRTFDHVAVNEEVMDVEREFKSEWKIALNTTEFLMACDLQERLARLDDVIGILPRGATVVDRWEDRALPLDNTPLVLQRGTNGEWDTWGRSRLIHRCETGAYGPGRHTTGVKSIFYHDFMTLWFAWSPYSKIRERKLKIKTRIPDGHIVAGHGTPHGVQDLEIDTRYAMATEKSYGLMGNERYAEQFARLKKLQTGRHSPIMRWE